MMNIILGGLSTFVRGNNSSGLMNIYKQLRALFACVVCLRRLQFAVVNVKLCLLFECLNAITVPKR
jgi:hypothetical protein